MNRRLLPVFVSFVLAFVVIVSLLQAGYAAAGLPEVTLTPPLPGSGGSGVFYDSGQLLDNPDITSVALGDLDGDGDLDAFVGNGYLESDSDPKPNKIWLNDGRGRFTDSGQLLGDDKTYNVVLGDLDGDNDLDVIVTNQPGTTQVWFNNGAGIFTNSGQNLTTDFFSEKMVSLGDVDGDSDLDAFIGSSDSPLWLNQGNGFFIHSGQSFGFHWQLALGDVDDDGDLDAVSTRKIYWNMGGQQGGLEGQFVDSGQFIGHSDIHRVTLGDLDGDTDLDAFLTASSITCNCGSEVWFNDGTGHFINSGQEMEDGWTYSTALADLDHDGDLDAFLTNVWDLRWTETEDNSIWLNDGTGHFYDSYQSLGHGFGSDVALGDLNGDGTVDAFIGMDYLWDPITDQISPGAGKVWFNKPNADLAVHQTAEVQGQTITYTVVYTNYGPDWVVGAVITSEINPALSNVTITTSGPVLTATVGFTERWQVSPLSAGSQGQIVIAGQFSGEIPGNRAEIAAAISDPLPANNNGDAYGLTVAHTAPVHLASHVPATRPVTATFSRPLASSTLTSTSFILQGSQTGRYEGNYTTLGEQVYFDPALPFKPGETVAIYLDEAITTAGNTTPLRPYRWQFQAGVGEPIGQGIGSFTTDVQTAAAPGNVKEVALGDLDGDGDLDAVLAQDMTTYYPQYGGPGASVWLNNGGDQGGTPGTFTDSGQALGSATAWGLALGDVDGDGDQDLFLANWSPWEMNTHGYYWNNFNELWLNDGSGVFRRSNQYLGGQVSFGAAFGDVDNDLDLDLVIANAGFMDSVCQCMIEGRNEIWLNDGQGHFQRSQQVLGIGASTDVALGDVDSDGDLDAFIINSEYENNQVWLNQGGAQAGVVGTFLLGSQINFSVTRHFRARLADVDADGDLDAIIVHMNPGGTIALWLNDGTGLFSLADVFGQGGWDTAYWDVVDGDFDGDGDVDLMTFRDEQGIDPLNQLWLNDGHGQFSAGVEFANHTGFMAIGDLDRDRDLDILFANDTEVISRLNISDEVIAGLQTQSNSPVTLGAAAWLTATTTSGTHVHYTWHFGDGTTATGSGVTHAYTSPGIYTVTVTATNSLSVVRTTTNVTVQDEAIAGLTASNDSPTHLNSATHLTATVSLGTNVTYTWDFGDGTSGGGAAASHTYPAVGTYTATVTASNTMNTVTATTPVVVEDAPITGLAATNSSPTPLNSATTFTVTLSTGTNVTYTWDFGDGASGSGAAASHMYLTTGIYTATVTASNSVTTITATTLVQIGNVAITGLAATNSSPTLLNSATVFTATLNTGTNVTYTWDFGDGASGSGVAVSHTYPAIGVYTTTVTATNSVNTVATTTLVQIVDVAIMGLIATNDGPVPLGQTIHLTATLTTGTNVTYIWNFGDGANGSSAAASHTYAGVGAYTATVTASNSIGVVTATTTVIITDIPIAGLAVTNSSPTPLGQATQFTATVSAGSNVLYTWDFGDGYTATGDSVNHIYQAPGIYTITVSATNSQNTALQSTTAVITQTGSRLFLPLLLKP